MNKISPKALLHSKWTHNDVSYKEKHFLLTVIKFDENQKVIECIIEAVISNNEYAIDWRELKSSEKWTVGWK
jgi:tryptophan-rich hypothetical protein